MQNIAAKGSAKPVLLFLLIVFLGGGVAVAASLEGRTQNIVPMPRTSEQTIPINLEVEGIEYQVSVAPGSSAYDVMVQARKSFGLSFEGNQFAEMGFFVEGINGLQQNPRAGKYWIYYINGQKAKVGISVYRVQTHDVISWKYEDEE